MSPTGSSTTRSIVDNQENMHLTEDDQISELEDRVKSLSYTQSFPPSTHDSAESIATPPESDFDDEQLRALLASPLYLQERGASAERSQVKNSERESLISSSSQDPRTRGTGKLVGTGKPVAVFSSQSRLNQDTHFPTETNFHVLGAVNRFSDSLTWQMLRNLFLKGTHLCNVCVDTRWLAHVLRDRPDGSHGAGGLLQVGGPVAGALWLQGFGERCVCLLVVSRRKKQKSQSVPERKMNTACHHRHVCTVQKHTPFSVCNRTPSQGPLFAAPSATHPGAALGRLGVRVTNQPTWCWARCSSAVRGLPRGQVCLAPWAAQGPVSVTMVSRGVLRDHGGSGCLYPFGTGGYPACY